MQILLERKEQVPATFKGDVWSFPVGWKNSSSGLIKWTTRVFSTSFWGERKKMEETPAGHFLLVGKGWVFICFYQTSSPESKTHIWSCWWLHHPFGKYSSNWIFSQMVQKIKKCFQPPPSHNSYYQNVRWYTESLRSHNEKETAVAEEILPHLRSETFAIVGDSSRDLFQK